MSKNKFSEKLKYSFDNLMSKGAFPMIVMLAIVSTLLIFLFSGIVAFLGVAPDEAKGNFFEIAWMSLMRTLDSGTMGGDSGTFGIIMFGVTLVGIFIISALIGIINNGLEEKLDLLRKGRSRVIESGHTVILGWSDQIF
ncbi:MAG TPA: hypothetical protein PK771_09420, partial [Spirochaetota bacterium]|nr:hypothetical protein [Spirochaetota bacterium]